jgi:hypothetical protein
VRKLALGGTDVQTGVEDARGVRAKLGKSPPDVLEWVFGHQQPRAKAPDSRISVRYFEFHSA